LAEIHKVVREVGLGPLHILLAYNPGGQFVYLVRHESERWTPAVLQSPFWPKFEGVASFQGIEHAVLSVSSGIPLEKCARSLTPEQAADALRTLAGALAAAEAIGLPGTAVSPRVLLWERDRAWRLDLMAAGLSPGAETTEKIQISALLGQCCAILRQVPRFSTSKWLDAVDKEIVANPNRPASDWIIWLASIQVRPLPFRGGERRVSPVKLISAALIAVVCLVGASLIVRGAQSGANGPKQQRPANMPEEKRTVQETLPPSGGSNSTEPKQVTEPPIIDTALDIPRWTKAPNLLAGDSDANQKEIEEEDWVPSPPRATRLPGPYCEDWGDAALGSDRYLFIDGQQTCTAHALTDGRTYISGDALQRVALLDGVYLANDQYTNRYGHLWIALNQATLNQFRLELVYVDRESIRIRRV